MQIQISRNGQTFGPYSTEQLQQHLDGGQVLANDLAWYDGAPDWIAVSQVPGVRMPIFTQPPSPRPYSQPVPVKTAGSAIASLVLGILAWIFLPFIGAVAAIITGHIARSSIRKNPRTLSGSGMALTGLILGYVHILTAIAVAAIVAVPVFAAIQQTANQTKTISNARQIVIACKAYSADHEGSFPNRLEELVPEYLTDASVLQSVPPSDDGSAVGFEYADGLTDSNPGDTPLIESKNIYLGGKTVIGFIDGSVDAIRTE